MITPQINTTGVTLVSGKFNIFPKFIGTYSGSGITQLTYQRAFLATGTNFNNFVTITKTPYIENSPVIDLIGYASGTGNYSFRILSKGDGIRYVGIITGLAFTGRF